MGGQVLSGMWSFATDEHISPGAYKPFGYINLLTQKIYETQEECFASVNLPFCQGVILPSYFSGGFYIEVDGAGDFKFYVIGCIPDANYMRQFIWQAATASATAAGGRTASLDFIIRSPFLYLYMRNESGSTGNIIKTRALIVARS